MSILFYMHYCRIFFFIISQYIVHVRRKPIMQVDSNFSLEYMRSWSKKGYAIKAFCVGFNFPLLNFTFCRTYNCSTYAYARLARLLLSEIV